MIYGYLNAITLFAALIGRDLHLRIGEFKIPILGLFIIINYSLIMGFRAVSVGSDTMLYSSIFNDLSSTDSLIEGMDYAGLGLSCSYGFLIKLISICGGNYRIYLIISSLIINLSLLYFIRRLSLAPFYSMFLWLGFTYFYCSMNGTRQFLAISLLMLAYTMFIDNYKDIRAWILLVIAFGFHNTAVVGILVPIGVYISVKYTLKKQLIISSISAVIAFLAMEFIIKVFVRFIPKYYEYYGGANGYQINEATAGGRIIILYLILFLFCLLYYYKHTLHKDLFLKGTFPLLVFSSLFACFNASNFLISRLLWTVLVLYIVFIPNLIIKYSKNNRVILFICTTITFTTYQVLNLLENKNFVMPYIFLD